MWLRYGLWWCIVIMCLIWVSHDYMNQPYYVDYHGKDRGSITTANMDEQQSLSKIKIVTYNIHYGKGRNGRINMNNTQQVLQQIDADIIALQEVERFSMRSNFTDQVEQLAHALGMQAFFYPSIAYPGLHYGNAILTKSPIIDSEVFDLPGQSEQRTAIIVELVIHGNKTLQVINTHLGLVHAERQQSHVVLSEYVRENISMPIILLGDFNAEPEQQEFTPLKDEGLHRVVHDMPTFHKNDWQIDYIFHSGHLQVNDVWVVESDSSDHFPLVAELQWK